MQSHTISSSSLLEVNTLVKPQLLGLRQSANMWYQKSLSHALSGSCYTASLEIFKAEVSF